MSDSLDGGIGHASDPGSIDGQAFAVEKTTIANGTTNTKKNAKAAKNQSRQSSQTTAAEDKPKYSWSEHVWSKFVSFKKIFSISLVSLKNVHQKDILFKIVTLIGHQIIFATSGEKGSSYYASFSR